MPIKGKASVPESPAQGGQGPGVPSELESSPDRTPITDDTPLSLPGISNFRELYDVFGSHSDPQFPQRVFEGKAFRRLIESGASRAWLEDICQNVDELSYDQKIFVSKRRMLGDFSSALRKAVRTGAELNSLPSGGTYGQLRHKLLLCLSQMTQAKAALDEFTRTSIVWKNFASRRGAPRDPAAEFFRWQVEHYPWSSRPPDRIFVELYRDITGKEIKVDSFRRLRRRDRQENR
ncbi:MAG: hypothetical protein ABSC63_20560 [Candidatus Binataceae bacterium]|jgi:hypothetical protein